MGEEKTFTTRAVTHLRCIQPFCALKRRIGRSLKLHDRDDLLCEAGIFVSDLFIRFRIVNRGGASAVDNHSSPRQASREWHSLMPAEMDHLQGRSAAPLPQRPVSEGTA